jgi:N-methylhydantoinase A
VAARIAADPGWTRAWWLRARYAGQGHELEIPVAPGDHASLVAERFAAAHAQRFGFTLERAVELVSVRHAASGPARAAELEEVDARDLTIHGRASVALDTATLLVEEGWTARALSIGGWLLERDD